MYYYLLNSIGLRSRLLLNELNIYLTFSSPWLTAEGTGFYGLEFSFLSS